MEKEVIIEKSLVNQVLDELIIRIEKKDEFDTAIIQKLRELATSGDLTKAERIREAIKIMPEVTS